MKMDSGPVPSSIKNKVLKIIIGEPFLSHNMVL